jgi:hypothetical protein
VAVKGVAGHTASTRPALYNGTQRFGQPRG